MLFFWEQRSDFINFVLACIDVVAILLMYFFLRNVVPAAEIEKTNGS
ncbi:MAG: hypothetical protein AAF573_12625 [Bacteroidota bacterium]